MNTFISELHTSEYATRFPLNAPGKITHHKCFMIINERKRKKVDVNRIIFWTTLLPVFDEIRPWNVDVDGRISLRNLFQKTYFIKNSSKQVVEKSSKKDILKKLFEKNLFKF